MTQHTPELKLLAHRRIRKEHAAMLEALRKTTECLAGWTGSSPIVQEARAVLAAIDGAEASA